MAVIFKAVEDNTKPFTLQLVRPVIEDGAVVYEPIDLTDATVDLIMYEQKTNAISNTGHQGCVIVDEPNGIIKYEPEAGDFDQKGRYPCDIRITYTDNTVEVLYEQLIIKARKKIT